MKLTKKPDWVRLHKADDYHPEPFQYSEATKMKRAKALKKIPLKKGSRLTTTVAMELFSTITGGPGVRKLSLESLQHEVGGASAVTVISAYYDVEFLEGLFRSSTSKSSKIRVLLNGLAGQRRDKQVEELKELLAGWRKRRMTAEVRLAFDCPGIFHSKLFLAETGKKRVALIGSANATTAAMHSNEEILLRLPSPPEALWQYAEAAWKNGQDVETLRPRSARNLVAFFRSGQLYFKGSASASFTLNPFLKAISGLDGEKLARLQTRPIEFSDPATGIGAFNLKRALGVLAESNEHSERASIKPYAVETCFGYWVPGLLAGELDLKLDLAGAGRKAHFTAVERRLRELKPAALLDRYGKYLSGVREALIEVGVRDAELKDALRPERVLEFRNRTLKRLGSPRVLQRLTNPLVSGPMPEIWDDTVAREDFETSFFEYLAEVAQRPTRNKVPHVILERAKSQNEDSWEEIREGLVGYLRNKGWAEDAWPRKTPLPLP